MKVSFAITCYNEVNELSSLINKLCRYTAEVNYEYEFVFLQDGSDLDILKIITDFAKMNEKVYHTTRTFNNDYSEHKNYLNSFCHGDYIFQIDADEYPSSVLVDYLGTLLEQNPVDLIWIPRVNTVEGLTNAHVLQWGWRLDVLEGVELNVVNWPDYQGRIYRNDPKIHWVNKVHEHIEGADKYTRLPQEIIWALYHPKTIERQEAQNAKYATMQR